MHDSDSTEEIIFNAARQLTDPDKRETYLDLACEGNLELRAHIKRLLESAAEADSFFGRSVAFAAEVLSPAIGLAPAPAGAQAQEQPGTLIGRYKLLQKLGEGGMGVVYMAEQEEPVRRKVAVKIIKLGMDTKQVVARFEAERQALALMDHPNIARVLDAGATDTGRPYFVMELVQGVPITEFCDQNQLSTGQRLKLFVPVCQAIQSAHQKGIIHRDLKPSNILVSLNPDGSGLPKVIDFGVAKATSQKLTEKTLFTAHGLMVGTPAYMSPEQAEMSQLDVDTRADVYSLGALLYELLTGTPPFPEQRLRSAGYNEIQRIILEEQPEKPSTRLSTLQGAQRSIVARNRGATELTLGRVFSSDLDWIVMKCLEKDRGRRYATANGLASDIERHLKNEPVVARPPSRLYEFQKTLQRHWVGFSAVAAIVAVLTLGVVVSSLQTVRARRAESQARERLAESKAISTFLTEVFQSPDPAHSRTITVVESLAAAATKLEKDLATQPARRAALDATLGLTYENLGLYNEAISLQEKVRDYYMTAAGVENEDTLTAVHNLASSYNYAGRREEALKAQEQVLAIRRKVSGPEHRDTLKAMGNLAISYAETGHVDEAIKLMEEGLVLTRKVCGLTNRDTLMAMVNLAGMYGMRHQEEKGLRLMEEALPLCRTVEGPLHPETLQTMGNLGALYDDLGRWQEGLNVLQEALPLFQKVMGTDHPSTLTIMDNLASCYLDLGRVDEAIKLREELLVLRRKVNGPQHPLTQRLTQCLAGSYLSVARSSEGIALAEQICASDPKDAEAWLELGTFQTWLGLDAEYEATRRRIVEQVEGTDQAELAEGACRTYCLRPSTDSVLPGKVLDLARKAVGLEKTNGWMLLALGLAEYRNGHYVEAEQTLSAAEQYGGQIPQVEGPAQLFRAMSLFRQGRTREARTLFHQAESRVPPLPKDERKPFADIKSRSQTYGLLIWWLSYKEARSELREAGDTPRGAGP